MRCAGLRTQEELAKEYVQLAIQYDNALGNTKYNLAKLLHNRLTQPPGLVGRKNQHDAGQGRRNLLSHSFIELRSPLFPFSLDCVPVGCRGQKCGGDCFCL